MATYTELSLIDLEKIGQHYGLNIIRFSPMVLGNANTTYHVHTKESGYIVTLAEEKSLSDMQALANLLLWLKQHGFTSSDLLLSHDGEMITHYKDKPVLIKRWVSGAVNEHFSTDMLRQIGQQIGKLHQVPVPDFIPKGYPSGLAFFAMVLEHDIEHECMTWLAKQIQFLSENLPQDLPKGLIHADIFFDNVLFEGDTFSAIIDFEEACYYDLMFDIGMAIVGLCQIKGKIDLLKAHAVIQGYEQVRPLLAKEKESLSFFIEYAATATACWRFWKYNIDVPSPALKDKYVEMAQIADYIHDLKIE